MLKIFKKNTIKKDKTVNAKMDATILSNELNENSDLGLLLIA